MKVNKSWNGPITTARPKKYVSVHRQNVDANPEFVEKRRRAEERKEREQLDKMYSVDGLDV